MKKNIRKKITNNDREVYYFIVQYKIENGGDSPTLREIGKSVGINSVSHVLSIIQKLEELKFIEIIKNTDRNRAIKVKGLNIEIDKKIIELMIQRMG